MQNNTVGELRWNANCAGSAMCVNMDTWLRNSLPQGRLQQVQTRQLFTAIWYMTQQTLATTSIIHYTTPHPKTANIHTIQTSIGHIGRDKYQSKQMQRSYTTNIYTRQAIICHNRCNIYSQQTAIQDRQVSVAISIGHKITQHIYTTNTHTR